MCVPAPTSWPPASTTTAPTAGLGDTNPTPARANSSVRRMCCSSIVIQEPFHHRDTEKDRFTNCEGENCDARLPHRALPMLRHQIDFADPVFWVMAHPPKDRQLKDRQVIRRVPGNLTGFPRIVEQTKGRGYQ